MAGSGHLTSARRYLGEHVFPDAPRGPRLTAHRVLLYAALAVLATALQLLRAWSMDPLEHLYAEDAFVWLADAQSGDPFSALTTTYAGYLQTSSRLVAEAVAELPVSSWAAAMAICGAVIVTGCAFVVWRTSVAQIRDRYLRAALAAMVVLLGVVGTEMLGNVVNTIWFIAFACFWLLLWRPPHTAAAAISGAALLFGAVSHSAVLFLAPLWLLRSVAVRDRRDALVVAGFAIGAALQIGFSHDQIGEALTTGAPAGQPFSTEPFWDWNLVPAYAQRVVGGAVGGHGVDAFLWENLGWPFAVALAAVLVTLLYRALRFPATRVIVPLTVAISIAMFLAAGYVRWGTGGSALFWPQGSSTELGARYVVTPALLLLAAVFIQVDAEVRSADRAPRRPLMLRAAVICVTLGCALVSFRVEPLYRPGPTWTDALDQSRTACEAGELATVDVTTMETPYGPYALPLNCNALR